MGALKCLAPFMKKMAAVISLLTTANIAGICEAAESQNKVDKFYKVTSKSDTRFYGVADEIASITSNKKLLAILPFMPEWETHLSTRNRERKEKIKSTMEFLTPQFWKQADLLERIFRVFLIAMNMTSGESTPMSAYLPICVACRNEVATIIQAAGGNDAFDAMCDEGADGASASAELERVLSVRFNFDGKTLDGRKKPLLDEYQVWAFVVDPY